MSDIIDKLYGGGEGGKQVKTPYYGSFQHNEDMKNGVGPPPASEGGPTAFEIYRHEGLVDEKGFMLSNPNVHMTTAALYGGGPQKITNNQSLNPDYAAGTSGNTVGGIGNTSTTNNNNNNNNTTTNTNTNNNNNNSNDNNTSNIRPFFS